MLVAVTMILVIVSVLRKRTQTDWLLWPYILFMNIVFTMVFSVCMEIYIETVKDTEVQKERLQGIVIEIQMEGL